MPFAIIEQRRLEIAHHAKQTLAAVQAGTAERGTVADLKADLLTAQYSDTAFINTRTELSALPG